MNTGRSLEQLTAVIGQEEAVALLQLPKRALLMALLEYQFDPAAIQRMTKKYL